MRTKHNQNSMPQANAILGNPLSGPQGLPPIGQDPARPNVASRMLLAWLAWQAARRRKRAEAAQNVQPPHPAHGSEGRAMVEAWPEEGIPEPPRAAPNSTQHAAEPKPRGPLTPETDAAQAAFLTALRAAMDTPSFPVGLSALQVRQVVALKVPGAVGSMNARLYVPRGRIKGAVLFLHGGGFVHCGLNSHHGMCCRLARISGAAVLLPDYRLAPEHPFPAAADDALAAYKWLLRCSGQLWGGKVAVAGDSAGGNLAAVVAQDAKAANLPQPALQLLYYPSLYGAQEFPSHTHYAEGYFLSRASMQWYGEQYITTPQDWANPRFVPGQNPALQGLPPAMIITAQCDPMRDEGAAYAQALKRAGVPVSYRCYRGALHGFLNFYACMPYGKKALRVGGRALRRAFNRT